MINKKQSMYKKCTNVTIHTSAIKYIKSVYSYTGNQYFYEFNS